MEADPSALAERFLCTDHEAVLGTLANAGSNVARATADTVAARLRDDALTHWNVWPRERTWVDHQHALVALSELAGVDTSALATALLDACRWQRIDGRGTPLDPDVFAWMMRWVPAGVYDAALDERSTGFRFLQAALWTFPDPRARAWMVDWFRTDPTRARFQYSDMRAGWLRDAWDAEEWSIRAHELCDAQLAAAPFAIDEALPAATSPAQIRLACTYATASTDDLLRRTAGNLRRHLSGDPEIDVELVWWQARGVQAERLRSLLEQAGAAGARALLVDTAAAQGRIDADQAAFLRTELPRPTWMDAEVPWEIDDVVEAGWVHAPDGRLSAADPYWAFEEVPFVTQAPPGRYPVRLALAVHPLHGRACAGVELVVDPATRPSHWERLGKPADGGFGYRVEVGVGSFGAVEALQDRSFHDRAPGDFPAGRASYAEVDAGDLGSIVMFHVAPQHQLCRTWAGRGADGALGRIVTDLGILHLDPEANPGDPLRPGRPREEPRYERPVPAHEREAGVASGSRHRPVDGDPVQTVTVLEVMRPEHCWLRTLAVWYRWDATRVGGILSTHEFRQRFAPLDASDQR